MSEFRSHQLLLAKGTHPMLTTLAVKTTTLLSTADTKIDLTGSWNKLVGALSGGSVEKVLTFLSIVGVILVIASIGGYLWQRRRGGGGNHSGLLWAGLVGALFAAPKVVVPIALTILDFLISALAGIVSNIAGS
jgi:hypothetical protein